MVAVMPSGLESSLSRVQIVASHVLVPRAAGQYALRVPHMNPTESGTHIMPHGSINNINVTPELSMK